MRRMDREAKGGKGEAFERPRNGNGNGDGHGDPKAARDAARRAADAISGRAATEEAEPGAAASIAGALATLASAPARLSARAAKAAIARVPPADLDERDPDYIRESLPGLWLLASLYFRGEVRGLGNIPEEGPVLLVGNHSGGNVTPDTGVFTLAFSSYFGVERAFYQLAHNLVLSMPGLGMLRKYGTVAASPENARKALKAGAAVLVYPGGDYEVHRPIWERHRIDFDGRKGWIRLALQENVPIVPVVAVGGQETSIFLSRGESLARALNLDRMFRLKVLPISLAFPWGLNIGDMLGHVPLPAKITVEALPPIDLHEEFGDDPDLDEAYDHILRLMQETLDALAAERRLPIIG
jgi:1-acyl-sn-glycerol-3-phosphate acyltransferase